MTSSTTVGTKKKQVLIQSANTLSSRRNTCFTQRGRTEQPTDGLDQVPDSAPLKRGDILVQEVVNSLPLSDNNQSLPSHSSAYNSNRGINPVVMNSTASKFGSWYFIFQLIN